MAAWPELEKRYYLGVFRRAPMTLVRGKGARVWDQRGKEYLDFVAGIAVNSLGHCPPVVVRALVRQAQTLVHTSNLYYTVPQLRLAELLVKSSGLSKIFFTNSGAEAVEGCIKVARKYGKEKLGGAYEIICAQGAFHGRTMGTLAATGNPKYSDPFQPLPGGFVHVPYDDVDAIKRATSKSTCAVLLEPVQGEGGVNVPRDGYLKKVRDWCDERGLLLALDEVQTGIGRTGYMFGFQHDEAKPDVMALAKGMGSGLPIGAFLVNARADVLVPGDHGSTFAGSALMCAGSYAAVRHIVRRRLPQRARELGEYFMGKLASLKEEFPFIKEVRGRGLLIAMEFDGELSQKVVSAAWNESLLVNPVKPTALRFVPPLVVSRRELDLGVQRLRRALGRVAKDSAHP
ncbi:MAG: aspartate aminotransferase family protein [SAR202 cluster bacterium]|nr:aspartate aminotransferase family protein [SAR202 cluster bacterium]